MVLVQIVTKAAPLLAKHLPKLWPLLLETKNRQRLMTTARDLADRSPQKQLKGRVELTAALAESLTTAAENDRERDTTTDWVRRARNLRARLDMPVDGREQAKQQRSSVKVHLDALQAEMDTYLAGQTAGADDAAALEGGTDGNAAR